jgi:TP901 family phage tail tape measure protein
LVDATEALTAAQKQFLLGTNESMRILDAWNEVENTTAVNTTVLTEALKRAGTASRVAGIDFDTFNGIVAAVGEATRKSGDTIGTAMKFIFQHMRDNKAVEALQQVGVYTEDAAGNFKSARNVLGDLAEKWDGLTDAERQNVAVSIAGTRHLNDFFTMMETWHRAIDISVTSLMSQGSAMRENRIVMGGLNKQVDQLKASWQSLWATIGQSGAWTSSRR